jgi:hypothetical protein
VIFETSEGLEAYALKILEIGLLAKRRGCHADS